MVACFNEIGRQVAGSKSTAKIVFEIKTHRLIFLKREGRRRVN
jgi:hypothetical protein